MTNNIIRQIIRSVEFMKKLTLFVSLLCISQISFCAFDQGFDNVAIYGAPDNFQRYETRVGKLHLIMLLKPLKPEHKFDQLIQKFIKKEGLSTCNHGIIVAVEQGTWGIPNELGFPSYTYNDGRSPQGLATHGEFVTYPLIDGNDGIIYEYRTQKKSKNS